MLRHLLVRDLVIVHELELTLAGGMAALTGETGAGKSILVDALGLALGDRADPELIRHGAERAEVSAGFDLSGCPAAADWLAAQSLEADGECILRRVLPRNGRSRAFINGSPVPLAQLAELGRQLVDIHGQHAHQSLLRPAAQRALLDAYAGHRELLEATGTAYRRLRHARRSLQELEQADQSRLDYVSFQLEELAARDLSSEHLAQLEADHRRLANVEALRQGCGALGDLLYDGDDAIDQRLARAAQQLAELARLDPALAEVGALLAEADVQIGEAAARLRAYGGDLESEPDALSAIEAELADLHDLARKHRVTIGELAALQEKLGAEQAALAERESRLQALGAEIAALSADYLASAEALSASRKDAASRLADEVSDQMQELGMAGGRFEVAFTEAGDGGDSRATESAHGLDRVEFQVAANPGQPLSALASTASGGELSRISLAIQIAGSGAETDDDTGPGAVPTLIFDEVDSGVGGAVAEIVGRLMRRLGRQRQVLCVTHLPQVAAQAHHHYRVNKRQSDAHVETGIERLDKDARIEEIARMLGGLDISKRTLAHAGEMIERGQTQGQL